MTRYYADNIVAIATGNQNGPVGIIRISGPDVLRIFTQKVRCQATTQNDIKPRYFYFGEYRSSQNQVLDQVCAVYMKGPNSFTGEDILELHCHGNQILLKNIIRDLLKIKDVDIRDADPGEFSKRAFLNGKMDLTQAESIHNLIQASSDKALQGAIKNLDGYLKKHVEELAENLKSTLALVEASFEFPEEDIQTFDEDEVLQLIQGAIQNLEILVDAYNTSKLYDEGVSVALVGRPNVGKSSLLNSLLVEDRAIVTDIPGTTRDVVEGVKIIDGIRFVFSDTAGIRETSDIVEQAGIQRSKHAIDQADIVLVLSDDLEDLKARYRESQRNRINVFALLNKIDLDPGIEKRLSLELPEAFAISALTNEGLASVYEALIAVVHSGEPVQSLTHINARQFLNLSHALKTLRKVLADHGSMGFQEEFLADDLRDIILSLAKVTGEISSDQVLGEIFQRFCIGK